MSDTTQYTGCTLVDEDGERIGDISDVIFGATSTTPEWLVVDPGMLRSERYVPASGSRRTARGDVVVPFRAHTVKSSPKADRRHILTRDRATFCAATTTSRRTPSPTARAPASSTSPAISPHPTNQPDRPARTRPGPHVRASVFWFTSRVRFPMISA